MISHIAYINDHRKNWRGGNMAKLLAMMGLRKVSKAERDEHYANNADNTPMNKMHNCLARQGSKGIGNKLHVRSSPYQVRQASRDVVKAHKKIVPFLQRTSPIAEDTAEQTHSISVLTNYRRALELLSSRVAHLPDLPESASEKEKAERVKLHKDVRFC